MWKRHIAWTACALVFTLTGMASAANITFDEVALGTSLDGVTIDGVTFDFRVGGVNSIDFTATNTGPGGTPRFTPPNGEGDVFGVLTLDFNIAQHSLVYDFALNTGATIIGATTADLFLGAAPVGTFTANSAVPAGFNNSEGTLAAGGIIFDRAVLTFFPRGPSRFAIDDIQTRPVPEPSTWALFGLGTLGLMYARRRRRRASTTA